MTKVNTAFLNGFRPILALWVAIGHFYKYLGGRELVRIPVVDSLLIGNGPAVDGFMIITGFLMMYHYVGRMDKESPYDLSTAYKFWIRRFFRLFPLYLIGILAAFFLFKSNYDLTYENYEYFTGHKGEFETTYSKYANPSFLDLFLHLTFLHGLFPKYSVTLLGPAWSLSTEVQYYVFFPLIFLLFNLNKSWNKINKSSTIIAISSIIITFFTIKCFGYWTTPGKIISYGAPSLIIHKISYFTFGMILALTVLKKISKVPLICWLVIGPLYQNSVISILVLIITFMMFLDDIKSYVPTNIFKVTQFVKALFSGRLATFGSDVSYSIYLIHMISMPTIVHLTILYSPLHGKINALIALIFFVGINTLISWMLYLIIEKPFITLGKSTVKKFFT